MLQPWVNWRKVETKNKQACWYSVLILLTNQHWETGAIFIFQIQNETVIDDFYKYFDIKKTAETISVLKGIDVSYAQGVIDWEKVKAFGLVDFAILRADYGKETSQIDDQFSRNYTACKQLGISVGAYWHSYATTVAEAEQEANVCLQTIQGKQFEYPVAFDIEEARCLPQADALSTAFCTALEKAVYYTAIYILPTNLTIIKNRRIKKFKLRS